jgi:hypothetical protein
MARGKQRGKLAVGASASGSIGPMLDWGRVMAEGIAPWLPEQFSEEQSRPREVPLDILAAEGFRLAALLQEYWEPTCPEGTSPLPGLGQHLLAAGFSEDSAEQLRGMSLALLMLDAKVSARRPWQRPSPVTEAKAYILEATRLLRHASDCAPGKEGEDFRTQLTTVRKRLGPPQADDDLGIQVNTWAALLQERWQWVSHAAPTANPAIIERGLNLAYYCLQRASHGYRPHYDDQTQLWLRQRDWTAQRLAEKLRLVRRVTDFALQEHPEVSRLAHSERRRQLRQQRRTQPQRSAKTTQSTKQASAHLEAP